MSTEPAPSNAAAFTHEGIAAALRAAAPSLAADDLAAAANTAASAWRYAAGASRGLGLRPHVETAGAVWSRAHRAGALIGHGTVAEVVTGAVLHRAEPARLDMSREHLQRANRLQAARLHPQQLRDYLDGQRWQQVSRLIDLAAGDDFHGGLIYQRHGHQVLIPPPGARDRAQRIAEAVAGIELVEDRSVAAILADLVPATGRPSLSHDALRLLERLYRGAADLIADQRREPVFPNGEAVAPILAELPDPRTSPASTPALAAQVGWTHGFRAGRAAGAAEAGRQLNAHLARLPARLRAAQVDGDAGHVWAARTIVDAAAAVAGNAPVTARSAVAGPAAVAVFPPLRPGAGSPSTGGAPAAGGQQARTAGPRRAGL